MDIISHGIQGGLIIAPFIKRWSDTAFWLIVSFFILQGLAPDLIGAYGNLILHDSWSLYISAHSGEIWETLKWFPGYFLHVSVDVWCHNQGGGWSALGWWIEVIGVPVTIYFTYLIITKRKQSQ